MIIFKRYKYLNIIDISIEKIYKIKGEKYEL